MDKSLIAFLISLSVTFAICTVVAIIQQIKINKKH